MSESVIYQIMFWIMWLLSVFILIVWHKSVKWWRNITDEILNAWEKSSTNFLQEYKELEEKYNTLLNEFKKGLSALEDDGK